MKASTTGYPSVSLHRLHAAGTKRTAGTAGVQATKGSDMASDEPAATLAGLGEFAVIDRLVAGREQPATVVLGPGDDAAVVFAGDGRAVVSTDMLVAGRHFRLDWSTPHDVGRKAIAQNAADIEAMGAGATAFVVAFGAPPDTATLQALELADGMWPGCSAPESSAVIWSAPRNG
jgi:hypothetical protein